MTLSADDPKGGKDGKGKQASFSEVHVSMVHIIRHDSLMVGTRTPKDRPGLLKRGGAVTGNVGEIRQDGCPLVTRVDSFGHFSSAFLRSIVPCMVRGKRRAFFPKKKLKNSPPQEILDGSF